MSCTVEIKTKIKGSCEATRKLLIMDSISLQRKEKKKGRGEHKKLQPPFFILGTTRELVGAKMPPTNVSGVVTLLRPS